MEMKKDKREKNMGRWIKRRNVRMGGKNGEKDEDKI
jgi:hypothetical protein